MRLTTVCVFLLVAAPAAAQSPAGVQETPAWGERDEEARSLFEAGAIAYRDGHFADAEQNFRRAYELSGRPELLFNIGTAAERARHDREAIEAYEEFLRRVPETEHRARVETRLRSLRELGSVAVSAPASAPVAAPGPPDPGAGPWIVIGGSSALAVVGAILLGLAVADVQAVESAAMLSRWADVEGAYERSEPLSIAAFVLLGAGVVGAAAGVGWVLASSGGAPPERASVQLRLGFASLAVEGRF